MEPVFDVGLEVTRWLQAAWPQLESFFQFISQLGIEEFYLAMLPLFYWSVDKRLGKHLAYVFLLGHGLNSLGKASFRGPRPFWMDSRVGLADEISYGVPSGHTEAATVFYSFLAYWFKRRWVTFLALFMIVAMGLSRIYLGVYFVHDVAAGLLVGWVALAFYFLWQRYQARTYAKRILGQRLLMALLVPFVLAFIYAVVRLIVGEADTAVSWASFIPAAEMEALESMATAVGALLGLGIGINLERSRVRFQAGGAVWKRVLRYVVGIIVTVGLKEGLSFIFSFIFPADLTWLVISLRIIRYAILLLWVGYYGPMVFVRLHLANADPDPGIQMTI